VVLEVLGCGRDTIATLKEQTQRLKDLEAKGLPARINTTVEAGLTLDVYWSSDAARSRRGAVWCRGCLIRA
jgi:hypothetical protein